MGNRKRRADRTYKDLKQKQKAGIADSMFQKTCDYYREHGRMPEGEDCEKIAGQIYQRVKGIAEKASFDEIYSLYLYRLPRYETRIAENGLPEKKEKKQDADKPKVKQKGRSKKVCPNCGRKMKQQFIGLQHCKCGMSWKKDIGYFERTGDMVTMQDDSFCIPDVQAGILYRFHCQFRCHRCAIGIADDFTAAQIHDRRQISPSFFLHMDVGNICAPFLVDGFCSKITF